MARHDFVDDIIAIKNIIMEFGERMVNGLNHVTFDFASSHIDICETKDGRLEVCEMDPSDYSFTHDDIHTYAPFEVSGFREKLEEKYGGRNHETGREDNPSLQGKEYS